MAKSLTTSTQSPQVAERDDDDRLGKALKRVDELELLLAAARAEISRKATRSAIECLAFDTPLLDESRAAGMFAGPTIAARFGEGKIGGERRRKAHTLFMYLHSNHMKLKDDKHINYPSECVLWILDNMKFAAPTA